VRAARGLGAAELALKRAHGGWRSARAQLALARDARLRERGRDPQIGRHRLEAIGTTGVVYRDDLVSGREDFKPSTAVRVSSAQA
jgi:hypothetical protein